MGELWEMHHEGLDPMNPELKDIGKRVIFSDGKRYEVVKDKRYNDLATYKRIFWWNK